MNNKKTLGNLKLQSKILEINLPQNIMELFDETRKMGYQTEEEAEYWNKKSEYNAQILKNITEVFENKFSKREKEVFSLMFKEGLTLTQTAAKLGIKPQSILKMKSRFIAKIKRKITYDFTFLTE